MKELIITPSQEGQKLERVLQRCLEHAPSSFLFRMLRKKNITLNGKKATGKELVSAGDAVQIWFSDETFAKFASDAVQNPEAAGEKQEPDRQQSEAAGRFSRWILYEDPHILLVNKPAGILTQKAEAGDVSLNEYAAAYLLRAGQTDARDLVFIRPSACNRLDRNTSGIVTIGKTQQGLRLLTELFRERKVHKEYVCAALGRVEEEQMLAGFLTKDHVRNRASISDSPGKDGREIRTLVRPAGQCRMENGMEATLLEIRLFTGRTHQIRAHLAEIGHPVIGDHKYGNEAANEYFRRKYWVRSQLLHARTLIFPDRVEPPEECLSGKRFTAQEPEVFGRIFQIT